MTNMNPDWNAVRPDRPKIFPKICSNFFGAWRPKICPKNRPKVTPKISPKGYAARTREKFPQKSVLQLAGALAREGCAEILGGKIGEQIRLDSEL